ncbi:hypothetical protein DSO57_1008009 [Entomophthora muscae]|uniref:Uncharacterized protein n=1 Tax=Entomophthora muscae TaxID=34485 RepID=A0ACC2UG98_9FUNG|nr:hypothetical protein DSO57_1008009 [Entomophthora muscae]
MKNYLLKFRFFDVSKQAFGGSLVHMLNVGVSIFSGGETSTTRNPCVWYLLNLLLDTTLGVGVLYVVLNFLHKVLDKFGFHSIIASGYYGKPPKASIWGGQFLVFLSGLILMKLLVVLILTMFPIILLLGQFFLSPFERLEDPRYQVVVVMLLVPLVMNVVQFWLTDHIIKARPTIPLGISTDNPNGFMNSSEPLLSVSGSSSSSPIHSPQFGPSLNDYDSDQSHHY